MTSTAKSIPDGYHCAIPMLAIKDATSAIEFYKQAFGAKELERLTDPRGKITYAEILIGDARIMLSDEYPEYNISPQTLGGSTVSTYIYVEDVDAAIYWAVAGAKVRHRVEEHFYSDRSGSLIDVATHNTKCSDPKSSRF